MANTNFVEAETSRLMHLITDVTTESRSILTKDQTAYDQWSQRHAKLRAEIQSLVERACVMSDAELGQAAGGYGDNPMASGR
jgi:hypothetical protein